MNIHVRPCWLEFITQLYVVVVAKKHRVINIIHSPVAQPAAECRSADKHQTKKKKCRTNGRRPKAAPLITTRTETPQESRPPCADKHQKENAARVRAAVGRRLLISTKGKRPIQRATNSTPHMHCCLDPKSLTSQSDTRCVRG